jgi:hypothetical protein
MEAFGLMNRRVVLGLLLAGMLPRRLRSATACAGFGRNPRVGACGQPARNLLSGYADCPYCQQWEAKARGDLMSPGLPQRHLLRRNPRRNAAPADRRAALSLPQYQKVYQQVGPSRGVAAFLLAVDGKVRLNTIGTIRYEEIFLPILRQVAERRANPS